MDTQNEELEVLMSIYPEEYELLVSEPLKKVKIHLKPLENESFVEINFIAELPLNYPLETTPIIDIECIKGLSKKHCDELKMLSENIANENIGMPSIFTICEGLKDWLLDNNHPGQDGSMYSDMMRRIHLKDNVSKKKAEKAALIAAAENEMVGKDQIDPLEEERIRKRQAGRPVTEETFNEWKARFDVEMLALQSSMKDNDSVKDFSLKLSGKQWFMLHKGDGITTGVDICDGEDEEALIIAGENEEITEEQLEDYSSEEYIPSDEDLDDEDLDDEDLDEDLDDEDFDQDDE